MRRRGSILAVAALAIGTLFATAGSATAGQSPPSLRVRTVPEVPGVRIEVDRQVVTTDAHGRAEVDGLSPGVHRLTLLDPTVKGDGTQLTFARWGDENYHPDRPVTIPTYGPERLQLGFDVSYLVSRTFVDQQGKPVPPKEISSIVMSSSAGGRFKAHAEEPIWVKGARIIRSTTGLQLTDITYSVTSVTVDGTNVVNQGQQRFLATANATWSISTLFYDATFTVGDRLFGFRTGSRLLLRYPDGHTVTYPMDGGSVTIPDLPRGSYTITVKGPGLQLSTPVAITRTTDSHLVFLSYLDVLVILLIGLGSAVGLVVMGRRRMHLMRALEERRRLRSAGVAVATMVGSAEPVERPVGVEAPVRLVPEADVPAAATTAPRRISRRRRLAEAARTLETQPALIANGADPTPAVAGSAPGGGAGRPLGSAIQRTPLLRAVAQRWSTRRTIRILTMVEGEQDALSEPLAVSGEELAPETSKPLPTVAGTTTRSTTDPISKPSSPDEGESADLEAPIEETEAGAPPRMTMARKDPKKARARRAAAQRSAARRTTPQRRTTTGRIALKELADTPASNGHAGENGGGPGSGDAQGDQAALLDAHDLDDGVRIPSTSAAGDRA
jgi:hypothetical protein